MFGNVQQNFAVSNTALFEAAVKWWESKRPDRWTLEQHLKSPTVNCGEAGECLAKEIAKIITSEMHEGEKDG
jgi:hypothetical protein